MELIIVIFLTLIALGVVVSYTILGHQAFKNTNSGGAKSFGLLFQRGIKFYTVILIVLAVVYLGRIDKIDSQAIVAILSGISGYILGSNKETEENKINKIKKQKNKRNQGNGVV